MSIGPSLGILGSAAGAPLAQTQGSEVTRVAQDSSQQQRQLQNDKHAEDVAGVDKTTEDQETSDRDADGRRLWEVGPEAKHAAHDETQAPERHAKDPDGLSGNQLDLCG